MDIYAGALRTIDNSSELGELKGLAYHPLIGFFTKPFLDSLES
jgi:hypothetical protein